jgi:hypothetical protein
MPSTQPFLGRPGETRNYLINFGFQPELSIAGDSLSSIASTTIIDAPNFTGSLPSIGSTFIPLVVTGVPVTGGGSGYTSPPAVSFSGGNPVGPNFTALAVAVLGTGTQAGQVVGIVMTRGGLYKTAPTASLSGGGGSGATVGSVTTVNDTRACVPLTGGVDQNDYLLTVTVNMALGSVLSETVLFQVRLGPNP